MRVSVEVLDGTGRPVEAELFDEVEPSHFLEAEARWRPLVRQAASTAYADGRPQPVHHWHWDWTSKAPELNNPEFRFYGIRCTGSLQGLMKVDSANCRGRLPEQIGLPLVYVDYLEVAPWNVDAIASLCGLPPGYRAIGTCLLEAAVRHSDQQGFGGRIALHTLQQSEQFYIRRGMTPVGPDPSKENLVWCELSTEAARRIMAGGKP